MEYLSLRKNETTVEDSLSEKLRQELFIPNSYQQFVANFINPNTTNSRILIKHSVGTGKTSTSIMSAMNFIETYKLFDKEDSPSIFILGFSKHVFQRELLKRPEFKFIQKFEIEKLQTLQNNVNTRGTKLDQQEYQNAISLIKRRFGNKKGYGHFKFYGYKMFFNRLFIGDVNDTMDEEGFIQKIKEGKIQWNLELLNSMKHGLIICDEAHNLFSSVQKNNWGIAIQLVSEYFKENIRIMYMSATILNNSPTEIVELLNLLSIGKKYSKSDLFNFKTKKISSETDDESVPIDSLKTNAERIIKSVCAGKVSLIEDINLNYFPAMTIAGESVRGIPYLKFIRCEVSAFQYKTQLDTVDPYAQDFALPRPDLDAMSDPKNKYDKVATMPTGMFESKEIKYKILNATPEWRQQYQIGMNNNTVTGQFMTDIKKYSAKYDQMMKDIFSNIKHGGGKIFIFHQFVHNSGAMFLQELMRMNNIADEFSQPTNNIICSRCGISLYNHKKANHEYKAARFIIATSETDKSSIGKSLDKYNASSNKHGHEYMILIGSQILKESYDLKCVRNLFITHRPDNIPTLMQIMGRCRRKYSHQDLPRSEWFVEMRIYTHVYKGESLYEELKYKEKVQDYKVIQIIEKFINESAVDLVLNYDYMVETSSSINNSSSRNTTSGKNQIGDLPFEYNPETQAEINLRKISDYHLNRKYDQAIKLGEQTIKLLDSPQKINNIIMSPNQFFSHHYSSQHINTCMYIIKRLFLVHSTYSYQDLFDDVRTNNFNVQMNPYLISEEIFNLALYNLVYDKNTNNTSGGYLELLTNNDKLISDEDGNKLMIVEIGKYYCLFPAILVGIKYVPQIDIENMHKKSIAPKISNINIKSYMKDTHYNFDFELRKDTFYNIYNNVPLSQIDAICKFAVTFHIKFLEEIILYINQYLSGKIAKHERHNFFFKILYYYDLLNLVIFATGNRSGMAKYLLIKQTKDCPDVESNHETVVNSCDWCPESCLNNVNSYYKYAIDMKPGLSKIPENLLPIGHSLDRVGRILDQNMIWTSKNLSKQKWKENDIIVGYLDKVGIGNNFKFKLRLPMQKIKFHNDARLTSRGNLCFTKTKEEILSLLKKLGTKVENANIQNLCKMLQNRLMYLDIEERRKGTNIRYFYYFHELDYAQIKQ